MFPHFANKMCAVVGVGVVNLAKKAVDAHRKPLNIGNLSIL